VPESSMCLSTYTCLPPPPPSDDQPDGPVMGTTLQPEIQDGHGTFIPGIDHATGPFMVTFTTIKTLR
jgi:hypothetical protein